MAKASVLRRYLAVVLEDAALAEALANELLARRFLSVADLALLPRVTPAVLAPLAPGLTIQAQQPAPAEPTALLALRLAPEEGP